MDCKKGIFLIIISIILSGCLSGIFDNTPPTIEVNEAINFNGQWIIYYNTSSFKVTGKIKDNGNLDYLKLNGDEIDFDNDGNFDIMISENNSEILFEVYDTGNNKTTRKIKLIEDIELPTFSEIKINNRDYTEHMIIGNSDTVEEIYLTLKVEDNNSIKNVTVDKNGDEKGLTKNNDHYEINLTSNGIENLEVIAKDIMGNTQRKTLIFEYDNNGPIIKNIKIDDIVYKDDFKYNQSQIKLEFDLEDNSEIKNIEVNENEHDINKDNFYELDDGENNIKIMAEDYWGNITEKDIKVNYLKNIEINQNRVIDFGIQEGQEYEEKYYTRNNSIEISFNVETDNGLDIEEVKLGETILTKSSITSGSSFSYRKNLELENYENTIQIEVLNEAKIRTSNEFSIYYDTEIPKIECLEETYINKDEVTINEIIDEINFSMENDNTGITMSSIYFWNSNEKSSQELVTVEDENTLKIEVEDISKNTTSKSIDIIQDKVYPNINLDYDLDITGANALDVKTETDRFILLNDSINDIKLNYNAFDLTSGILNIKYGEEILENKYIDLDKENLKKIYLEDYAGNIRQIDLDKIDMNMEIKYSDSDITATQKEGIHYVGNSSYKINLTFDEDVLAWKEGKDNPNEIKKEWTLSGNDLEYGDNQKRIYVEDGNGNRVEYSVNIFYDVLLNKRLELNDPNNITTDSMEISWNTLEVEVDYSVNIFIAEDGTDYPEDPFSTLKKDTNSKIIDGLLDNTKYKIKLMATGDKVNDKISNEIIKSTSNKTPEDIELDTLEIFYDETKDEVGFNLNWEEVYSEDKHDFQEYWIYRDDKIIKSIQDLKVTSYSENFDIDKENKKYKYGIKVVDNGGASSNISEQEEYTYNLPPNLDNLNISESGLAISSANLYGEDDGNKKIELNFEMTDMSPYVYDLSYYKVYRTPAQKSKDEDVSPSIFLFSYSESGTIKTGEKMNDSDINITSGALVFKETNLKENYYYKYKIIIEDENQNVNENNIDKDENNSIETVMFQTIDLTPAAINFDTIKANYGMDEDEDFMMISWDKPELLNEEDFQEYIITRGSNSKTQEDINNTTYIDNSISLGNSYRYEIQIKDQGQNISDTSFVEVSISSNSAIQITTRGAISN
ncbi:MAG: hypothetical protein ACQERZ_07525 [Fusobacteriota bacterium]